VPEASSSPATPRNPWAWIPTLYFAEGLPNAIVTTISIVIYKSLGVSNTRIGVYTGLFYLPWVVKPLWSPVVDILKTRRLWIWRTQCLLGLAFAGIALSLPSAHFLPLSIVLFWIIAFSSATHDIAADGFYILALSEGQQSFFVGVRNTIYRLATLFVKGPFIFIAAEIKDHTGNETHAWTIAFAAMAALFGCLGAYHGFILPRPANDRPGQNPTQPNTRIEPPIQSTPAASVSPPSPKGGEGRGEEAAMLQGKTGSLDQFSGEFFLTFRAFF
jgi:MFS transporter, PAT family, beta-lactamase induction signal transducer AmpG